MRWMTTLPFLFLCSFLHGEEVVVGKLIKVKDGDTFTLIDADKTQHVVILKGIDAPELPQPFGGRARQKLRELLRDQEIQVRWDCRDKNDRLVGEVFVGEQSINRMMVNEGLAWVERKPPRNRLLLDVEAEAKSAGKGLWHDPHPVAPWDFRRTVYWP